MVRSDLAIGLILTPVTEGRVHHLKASAPGPAQHGALRGPTGSGHTRGRTLHERATRVRIRGRYVPVTGRGRGGRRALGAPYALRPGALAPVQDGSTDLGGRGQPGHPDGTHMGARGTRQAAEVAAVGTSIAMNLCGPPG